jgi:N-dimethylarginine dimethylaminohydrolase
MGIINTWDEWSRLEEVIVGRAEGAMYPPPDVSTNFIMGQSMPHKAFPERIIEETAEDLESLVSVLKEFGSIVHRPSAWNHSQEFETPLWRAHGFCNYCPRDILLTYGNTVIESPNALRARHFETASYKHILKGFSKDRSRWIVAPKPELPDNIYDGDCQILTEYEPIFDAANVLKLGKDILFQISVTGNHAGLEWLKSILGDSVRIHPVENVYKGSHLDSTIAMLRPGLVLLNPSRVSESSVPAPLSKWDKIWCPPIEGNYDYSWAPNLMPIGSQWIEMNVLSLDSDTVIVDKDQRTLISLLESCGITCIPLKLRHGRLLGGGFHCVTVDIRRSHNTGDYTS